MKKINILVLALSLMSINAFADETIESKAKELGNDTKRTVKKGARAVKDKTCEMVNGKMECAAQKVKHSMQNVGDKVEDAVD
jgi:uncharacterized protein YjbJ (UPF0337 family)